MFDVSGTVEAVPRRRFVGSVAGATVMAVAVCDDACAAAVAAAQKSISGFKDLEMKPIEWNSGALRGGSSMAASRTPGQQD